MKETSKSTLLKILKFVLYLLVLVAVFNVLDLSARTMNGACKFFTLLGFFSAFLIGTIESKQ